MTLSNASTPSLTASKQQPEAALQISDQEPSGSPHRVRSRASSTGRKSDKSLDSNSKGHLLETQLRRIASERKKAKQEQKETSGKDKVVAIEKPTARQLAIYINGKIRSNSIFCRSNSAALSNEATLNSLNLNSTSNGHLTNCTDVKSHPQTSQRESHSSQFKAIEQTVNAIADQNQLKDGHWRRTSRRLANQTRQVGGRLLGRVQRSLREHASKRANFTSGSNLLQIPENKKGTQGKQVALGHAGASITDSLSQRIANQTTSSVQDANLEQAKEKPSCWAEERDQEASYKLNPSSMFLQKAMRYYRLWIYCTNVAILVGTALFAAATIYVISDFRIKLLVSSQENVHEEAASESNPSQKQHSKPVYYLSFSEPALLLGYVAMALQAGLLQAIGCFGSIRMKERWIQAFWLTILGLTLFDVAFLVYWLHRYEFVVKSLKSDLSARLTSDYAISNSNASGQNNVFTVSKRI